MLRKLIAILPLIVAPAFAQQAVTSSYGKDLVQKSEDMSLTLSARTEKGSVTLCTENGEPGAPATLMIGVSPAATHLGIVGVDAWLLVAPIAVTGTMAFHDNGSSEVTFPLQLSMVDAKFCVQAASIWFDPDGPHADFSNGLALRIEG